LFLIQRFDGTILTLFDLLNPTGSQSYFKTHILHGMSMRNFYIKCLADIFKLLGRGFFAFSLTMAIIR